LELIPAMIGGTKIKARYVTIKDKVIMFGIKNAIKNPATPNSAVISLA
jgi:hypothetical protein